MSRSFTEDAHSEVVRTAHHTTPKMNGIEIFLGECLQTIAKAYGHAIFEGTGSLDGQNYYFYTFGHIVFGLRLKRVGDADTWYRDEIKCILVYLDHDRQIALEDIGYLKELNIHIILRTIYHTTHKALWQSADVLSVLRVRNAPLINR